MVTAGAVSLVEMIMSTMMKGRMKIDMEKNKDNWVSECEDNVNVDEKEGKIELSLVRA